jgi:hypothetical protein
MDAGGIAAAFEVTRQTARAWMTRPGFPPVLDHVANGSSPIYDGLEVREWVATQRPKRGRPTTA